MNGFTLVVVWCHSVCYNFYGREGYYTVRCFLVANTRRWWHEHLRDSVSCVRRFDVAAYRDPVTEEVKRTAV